MANTTGKKFGGRAKGTPNRLTKELRVKLKNILYNEIQNVEGYLEEIEPKEKLEIIIKLMPYVFPKVGNTSHTDNEPIDWNIN